MQYMHMKVLPSYRLYHGYTTGYFSPKGFLNNQAFSHFSCILIPFSRQLLCFPYTPAISGHALTQTFPKAYNPAYLTVNIT